MESRIAVELLKERDGPDDIMLIDCPFCGNQSYYDQGFTCSCEHCGREIAQFSDDAYTLGDYWIISPADVLADLIESENDVMAIAMGKE
jgi:ribosomal protein S27E